MAENRPADDYYDNSNAEQDAANLSDDGLVYYFESVDGETTADYDVGEDGTRFYIDGFDQSADPESDGFDEEFDEDYPQLSDEEFSDLDGLGLTEQPAEEETTSCSEDDEFDNLDADENVYGGDDYS